MNLTCIILAKNEAEMIGDCIDSLRALEPREIIVIDDGSTDETASIARFKKAEVISHHKQNFAEVEPELAKEIMTLLRENPAWDAGRMRRINYYLGKRWPTDEKVIRLFRKANLKEWYGELHESPIVNGTIFDLSGSISHCTHRTLAEMVEKTLVWSEIEASLRFNAHHPPVSWWRIPRVMLPVFWDYYIRQGGWKAGTVGLIESIYQAFSIFITYSRLWELQQKISEKR